MVPVAARRPFVAALTAVFLGAVDLTVIATVLPEMVFDLRINTADVDRYIWVVNAYLIAYIVSIPVMGRLSDLVGRAWAFQIALAVFLAGSVWSALASDLQELIAARAVQGAGGGALLPVAIALTGDLLPAGRRFAALGIVAAVDTIGWVLGPVWGAAIVGLVDREESWRWVFWINLPLGVVVAAAIAFSRVRGDDDAERGGSALLRLDLPGSLLLGAGLLLLNLGLSAGGEAGLSRGSAMRALGGTSNPLGEHLPELLASGAFLLGLFVLWERRARYPLVPRELARARPFVFAIATNFLVGWALIVAVVDVPVTVALLVDQDRISTVSALLLAPFTFAMAGTSFAGGLAAARFGEGRTAILGVALAMTGYVALWAGLQDDHYRRMIPGLLLAGAGFGMTMAPISARALDAAAPAARGVAAALVILFRLLGMTIGISTLTSLGVRRLQSLTSEVEPVVQQAGESTAEFFVRQNEYIERYAIPLSLQVVRETFLMAAGIAALAAGTILLMRPAAKGWRPSGASPHPQPPLPILGEGAIRPDGREPRNDHRHDDSD